MEAHNETKARQTGPITRTAASFAALLLAGLVLFQLALALGVPWGRAAYGGQSAELSATYRATSAVAALVWTGVATAVLRHAGVIETGPQAWTGRVIWIVVGVLGLSVLLNAITPSALERAIWLPTTILLFGSTLVVALTARR